MWRAGVRAIKRKSKERVRSQKSETAEKSLAVARAYLFASSLVHCALSSLPSTTTNNKSIDRSLTKQEHTHTNATMFSWLTGSRSSSSNRSGGGSDTNTNTTPSAAASAASSSSSSGGAPASGGGLFSFGSSVAYKKQPQAVAATRE